MLKLLGIIWNDRFTEFFFSPRDLWPVWLNRMRRFRKLLDDAGVSDIVDVINAQQASEDVLLLVHDEDYIKLLKKYSELGYGVLDYGDTIAYEGIFNDALLIVGATLKGLELVLTRSYEAIYQPFGGLHHARKEGAAGFCPVNDIAIAIEYARRNYKVNKVVVIDIDVHHGDGTQTIYYGDSSVLTISIHMKAPWFYPGTGDVSEIGEGEGRGYSINIPLPPGTGDEGFRYVFSEIIPKAITKFKPDLIIAQLGVDGHKEDLLGGLRLTTNTYMYVTETLRSLAKDLQKPLLGLGGGGYGNKSAEAMLACVLGLLQKIPESIESKSRKLIYEKTTRDPPEILAKIRDTVNKVNKIVENIR